MNKLDKAYTDLLQDILDNGYTKGDRTGTGTVSVFGRQIRHKMSDGFPLLTTKKMAWKQIVTELLWLLRGDTNIKYLVDNNCHIWDGDAYKNYTNSSELRADISKEEFIHNIKMYPEFAKKYGELGPVYGRQWRKWPSIRRIGIEDGDIIHKAYPDYGDVDQIANLIRDLKTNPDSRRLMVNAWNVGELDQMVLPPCHYGFQVYTRELSDEERARLMDKIYGIKKPEDRLMPWLRNDIDDANIPTRAISLMWNQRSVDTFLGLPFNIASYGLLLEIIAKAVNMVPDELIGNLGDVHLYSNHIEQAKEQIGRELTNDEWIDLMVKKHGMVLEGGDDKLPKRTREPYPLPKLNIKLHFNNEPSFVPEYWLTDDFELINYKSHSAIKAQLSN
jgi:thymidylate synthase